MASERTDGRLRWAVPLTHEPLYERSGRGHDCSELAASAGGVFCLVAANRRLEPATPAGVAFFAKRDGARRQVLASEVTDRLFRIGSSVVSLQRGATVCTNGTLSVGVVEGRANVGVTGTCVESASMKAFDGSSATEIRVGESAALGFEPSFVTDSHASDRGKTVVCAASVRTRLLTGRHGADILYAACMDDAHRPVARVQERIAGANLALRERTNRFLVVDTGLETSRSVVVDMHRGEAATHAARVVAVVRGDAGLDALLAPPDLVEVDGTKRWPLPENLGPDLHGVRAGDRVVVSSYDHDAPGVTLTALDAKTGATAWTADVELRAIPKSPGYHASVDLSVDGDGVVLEGRETSQQYLEIFSLADGRRLVSVVRAR